MFGIFERLRELEREIAKINKGLDCQKNYHNWYLTAGYDNGLPTGKWISGKKCTHCDKFIALTELTPKKDS